MNLDNTLSWGYGETSFTVTAHNFKRYSFAFLYHLLPQVCFATFWGWFIFISIFRKLFWGCSCFSNSYGALVNSDLFQQINGRKSNRQNQSLRCTIHLYFYTFSCGVIHIAEIKLNLNLGNRTGSRPTVCQPNVHSLAQGNSVPGLFPRN